MTFKRRGTRERRAIAEQAVLDATRELLREGIDFADLTVEQIARHAGISRPAFYGHFVDKSALLVRLVETVIGPVSMRADEELGGLPSGPAHVEEAVSSLVVLLTPSIPVLRSVVQTATYDHVVRQAWQRMTDGVSGAVASRIRQQQEAGIALPGDADLLAHLLVTTTVDTIGLHMADRDDLGREALAKTLALMWRRSAYGSA